jgi:hypothetical protein
MRFSTPFWQGVQAAVVAGLAMCAAPGCKPAAHPANLASKTIVPKVHTFASASNNVSAEYVSVFEQLMPPKGRDPFFPNSHRRDPQPSRESLAGKAPVASELVLKGIVGSRSHRLAVINNVILEVGEEGTARAPGGKVRVKCLEIGEDYAVIKVEGEIQPKRLGLNRKGF